MSKSEWSEGVLSGTLVDTADPRRDWLRRRLRALRAFSFPVSALPVAVAVAAVAPVREWRWDVLLVSVVGVVMLHAGGNLLNDYFDFRSGVDRKEEGDEDRPGRLLVRGELSPGDVLTEAIVVLALAACAGVYLVWRCGPGLLWFAAGALAGLYAYTGPPLELKYRSLGEPVIFLVFGPLLMAGAAYVQTLELEISALVLSIPIGLGTTAILVGNNLRDREEDADAGIVTLVRAIGTRGARAVYVGCIAGCVAGVGLVGVVGWGPRVLTLAPAFALLLGKALARVSRGERVADIDVQTARFETVLLVFVLVTLILGGAMTIGG